MRVRVDESRCDQAPSAVDGFRIRITALYLIRRPEGRNLPGFHRDRGTVENPGVLHLRTAACARRTLTGNYLPCIDE